MKRKLGKILRRAGISVLALLLVLCMVVGVMWRHEIAAMLSIEMLADRSDANNSAPVYIMDVGGDYYFDEFLARGGASSDGELLQFVADKVTKGLVPLTLEAPELGCASFTCMDEAGNRYFARNYDLMTTTSMIVRTNPGNGRYASISSVDLQFIGIKDGGYVDSALQKVLCLAATYVPIDGINEAGVSCGIYMSYQGGNYAAEGTDQNTDRPDLTSTTMLRLILDYAGSVEEAVELVRQYDLHDSTNTPFHYMVADSTGKSAILEWVAETHDFDRDGTKRELKVYYNDDDAEVGEREAENRFQYVTNFIVAPDYYIIDRDKHGLDRYQEIERQINPDGDNPDGVIAPEKALELLQTISRRSWDKLNGWSDANGITVWSALFDLTNRSVTWVSNECFDDPGSVFTFDFSYLD